MNTTDIPVEHIKSDDCIFCKVIAGEIPARKVYEDSETLAFLDINPNTKGHTLVVPKDHFENIYTIPDEALCRVAITVRKVATALRNGTDADGINLIVNNETAAGQEVPHVHFHVIPRHNDDGLTHWPHVSYNEGEAEEILEKITAELKN